MAYTKTGVGTGLQVWTYSPARVHAQVSKFQTASYIEALGPNGEVVFANLDLPGPSQRYLSAPPYDTATPLGTAAGRVIWRDGRVLLLISGSVFQVQ